MYSRADDGFGIIHSLEVTGANEHELNAGGSLPHGDEARVFDDSGYRGINKRREHQHRNVDWFIARLPSATRQLPEGSNLARAEKIKASVRAKVEHPFRTIKRQFGYAKVRSRGLAKNANRLYLLAAFSNMLIGERYFSA
ncbi:transposase [Halospina denitrificans]|uniref:transposase n=1 Tax=Halospina denitrificans TaxID=332522 RepID=UPI00105DB4AA|nr:transposase [Halospina denitrificans]